ncbi:MAG: hypothetical protein HFI26_09735 [Lachnospiraceae bacterium]|jgi:hypothetical protein|nr:hypothetical protein [Lachnospiraceae bacterium]
MTSHTICRRNLLLLSLFITGSLFFGLFFVLASYYQAHPSNPAFLLRINEVCTINPGTEDGENVTYEDYVELYNPSDREVSLENVFLSDSTKDFSLGPLPADTIAAGGYYVIYMDGLPFRLSENETLTLSYCTEGEDGSRSFSPIDSLFIPSLERGAVYARPENEKEQPVPMRPSPGKSNETASQVLKAPVFSAESGFYQGPFSLHIQASEGLSVYYTLDGSEPGPDSLLYTEPLILSDPSLRNNVYSAREDITSELTNYTAPKTPVDKAVVLRAAAYDREGNYSRTITAVYFLDFEAKEGYENTAVLSLVTDPANLFDSESGIYIRGSRYEEGLKNVEISPDLSWSELTDYLNYYLEGAASERPAHLAFFDPQHARLTEQECGIRIRGNESRNFPQKSFTLFSRNRYEAKTFEPVFFDTGFSYPTLILNNSSQLKKVFFFSLTENRNAASQKYTPCQVFLNGEYWGLYYLMEKYSSEYLESYYGVDAQNTLLIKNSWEIQDGNPDGASGFKALKELLAQDMSDPQLYGKLLTQMDMQSFIDWMCTNIYIANTDTKPLGGNVFTWQAVVPGEGEFQDGKWRWMLYDLDDSLGVGIDSGVPAYAVDSFVEHAGYAPSGFLEDDPMPSLMKSEEFRRQFVLTFMDMANECFRPSHVLPLLDRLEEQYEDAAAKSYERWNTEPSDAAFTEQAEELRTFFANRYDAIVPCLAAHFSLTGDLVPVALSSNAPEGGTVTLNTLTPDLSASVWSGSYYTDYPIRLTASPAEGYIFTGWETTDCEPLTAGSSPVLEVRLRDNSQPSIKAVFEKLPSNRQ